MKLEELGTNIKAIIRKAYPYGWAPYLLEDIRGISKGTEKKPIAAYINTKLKDESTSKEEFIVLAILSYQKNGKDYKSLASFIHTHLKSRLHNNDIYFLVHALFPDDYIPLPRSLVYDITERLLLNIEMMYKKIVRDFQKVPVQNVNQVVLFLTMQYCRKDLNTQNQEMIALILSHIEADVPREITKDVKQFLVRTFLQEIARSNENVQLNKQLYKDLESYAQEEQKQLEKESESKELDEHETNTEKKPIQTPPQKGNSPTKTEQTQQPIIPQDDTWKHRGRQTAAKEEQSSDIVTKPNDTSAVSSDNSAASSDTEEAGKTPSKAPSSEGKEDSAEITAANENTSKEETDIEVPTRPAQSSPAPDINQELFQLGSKDDNSDPGPDSSDISESMPSKAEPTYQPPPPPQQPIDSGEAAEQRDDKFRFNYAELKEENVDGIKLKDIDLDSLMEEKEDDKEKDLSTPFNSDEEHTEVPEEIATTKAQEEPEAQEMPQEIPPIAEETEETEETEEDVLESQKEPLPHAEKGKKKLVGILLAFLLVAIGALIVTLNNDEGNDGTQSTSTEPGNTVTNQNTLPQEESAQSESSSTAQQTDPIQTYNTTENSNLTTNQTEQIPTNSQKIVLEQDGISHTFYLEQQKVWWEASEGDYFYKLFQFIQNLPPTDLEFVNEIKSLTWSYYLLRLRRYNPQLENLDIILPTGVYVIASVE